ncbi:MAG: DUF2089 domain-containing protein [Planctomycetes bacterium]|nr:DUF2089 domain-containing protein [Planctomycetota bacterium]
MPNQNRWVDLLEDEDIAFLKRFVLASGSLKELAEAYGISYPTVRLRLDRLIAKVQVFDSQQDMTDFERTLRAMHADGRIDQATLKQLLKAYQREREADDDAKTSRSSTRGSD